MKFFTLFAAALISSSMATAQTDLAPDQNPRHGESLSKYTRIADSLNALHGTTIQNTYKAYDFMEARAERRDERRNFRRQLRLLRASRFGWVDAFNPYQNAFMQPYGIFNSPFNPYSRWWWR